MQLRIWLVTLSLFGGARPAIAEEPAIEQPASGEELRGAVGKSLPLLLKAAVGHRENRTCFACHNQGLPILALIGAAMVYESVALIAYAGVFLLLMHGFVLVYEEPTLRRTFGRDYDAYCLRVRRWRPTLRGAGSQQ